MNSVTALDDQICQSAKRSSAAPLISVIMPCFNAAPYLEAAITSVMQQTYQNVELIVIDDGSHDDSVKIVVNLEKEYPKKIRFVSQANAGPYPARNHGLRLANGDFIAFLDADDWWEPEFLNAMYTSLSHAPEAALAYCGWQNFGATHRSNDPFVPRSLESHDKLEVLFAGGSPWPIHAALTRRSVIDSVGGFQTDLETSADFDLWLRIAGQHRIVLVPRVLANYRFHGDGQISSRPWLQAVNGWRFKRRLLSRLRSVDNTAIRRLRIMSDKTLINRGYDFYWKGQFAAAHYVFRFALRMGIGDWRDMKHFIIAMLPYPIYSKLLQKLNRIQ